MTTSIQKIIRRPACNVFRRAYIKRRSAATGLYETNWQEITPYVLNWGSFVISVDDVRLNKFTASGLTIKVKSEDGKFNRQDDINSLWHGYLPRYRTLVKIEAGYLDGATEYPSVTTQGIFLIDKDIRSNIKTGDIDLVCRSLVSPFEETRADQIGGIATATATASDIVQRIRDATDGSSNYLFQNFIPSAQWNIHSTTTIYNFLNTTTILENYSVWELMNKIAEAENHVVFVDRSGGINFVERFPSTNTSIYSMYGGRFKDPNIIELTSVKEALDKLYTNVRIKYVDSDTSTSYLTLGDSVQINNSNTSWIYGRRTYEFENTWLDTASASRVASTLVNKFAELRLEAQLKAKFTPHLDVMDRIDVSYRETDLEGSRRWDFENWASDAAATPSDGLSWDKERGSTVEWWNKNFVILSKQTDLDNMTTTFTIREAEG